MKNNVLSNILVCGLILTSPLEMAAAAPETKAPSSQASNWKTFTSTKNNYSIKFPSAPEHIEQMIEIPKSDFKISYNTYISEPDESAVYVVSVWDYPEEVDMSKPEVNLQDGFNGMLSALPGSEVQSMNMAEVQGHKALSFLVKNDDIYFQGKLILVNNTLYQIFVVYKEGAAQMTSDYNQFVESFKLTNDTQPAAKKKKKKKVSV